MSRLFYHVMQDHVGNLLFDVSGTMRLAGTGTLATIYGDEALTVVLPNPMTNHPSFGSFKCFLGAGDYDFYMAKAGYTFETLTGVQGHGTLAQQDAHAVAITGGVINGPTIIYTTAPLIVSDHSLPSPTAPTVCGAHLALSPGPDRYNLLADGLAQNVFFGPLGLGPGYTTPEANFRLSIDVNKNTAFGIKFKHSVNDTGGAQPVIFSNVAGTDIGSIATTATATAYNTASDGRLKDAIQTLPDALATLLRLRPVQFRWKTDGTLGVGFVAQEVVEVVPEAVTGTPDAVDAAGRMVPMGMDFAKLVPVLVGAVQALAQQVQTLTARLEAAGG